MTAVSDQSTQLLRAAYAAFNARDINAALQLMTGLFRGPKLSRAASCTGLQKSGHIGPSNGER